MQYRNIFLPFLFTGLVACGGGGESGGSSSGSSGSSDGGSIDNPEIGSDVTLEPAQARMLELREFVGLDRAIDAGYTGAGVTMTVVNDGYNDILDLAIINFNAVSGSYEPKYTQDGTLTIADPDYYDSVRVGPSEAGVFNAGSKMISAIAGDAFGILSDVEVYLFDSTKVVDLPVPGMPSQTYQDNEVYPIFQEYVAEEGAALSEIILASNADCEVKDDELTAAGYDGDGLNTSDAVVVCAGGNDDRVMTDRWVNRIHDAEDGLDAGDNLWVLETGMSDHFLYVGGITAETNEFDLYELAYNSNYPGTDTRISDRWIVAPGVDVSGYTTDLTHGKEESTEGAATFVASAMVMIKQAHPGLSGIEIANVLLDTADDTFNGYSATLHGQGILDVDAALDEAAIREAAL